MPKVHSETEGTWGHSMVFRTDKSQEIIQENNTNMEASPEITLTEEECPLDETIEELYISLSYLDSSLFATILEDTITQLRILVECNNELRIIKTYSDWGSLLKNKYGVPLPKYVDELEGIDPHNLGCNEYKINKLDHDRKIVTDSVMRIYLDLCLNTGFKELEDIVKSLIDTEKYQVSTVEEEAKNRILRRDLNKQLRHQRNHIKTVLYDAEVKIDELKTEVEDSVFNFECRSRYVNNWQNARTEQHIQNIHDKENVYSESIEYFKQRTDHEQRVHMEIDVLMNIHINETMREVEKWMDKYDRDMEAIDLKIQRQKNDYQDMLAKRINLEETIVKHEKMMKEWVQFKDDREKARQYHDKMTMSAIIVQAWWRGMLVRRQLGPYKVTKKRGAPKDKKK